MRFSVVSGLDSARAFALVADFGDLGWDPLVRSADLVSGAPLAVGAEYELRAIGGMTLRYELIESDPPRRVVYRGGTRRVTSSDTIEVEPRGEGSVVRITSELSFAGWTRLAGPLIRAGVWSAGRLLSVPALRRNLDNPSRG